MDENEVSKQLSPLAPALIVGQCRLAGRPACHALLSRTNIQLYSTTATYLPACLPVCLSVCHGRHL